MVKARLIPAPKVPELAPTAAAADRNKPTFVIRPKADDVDAPCQRLGFERAARGANRGAEVRQLADVRRVENDRDAGEIAKGFASGRTGERKGKAHCTLRKRGKGRNSVPLSIYTP